MSLDPEKMIDKTDKMLGDINRRVSFLRAECEDIAEQWQGLGMACGQRADHAAVLLGRLRPHLRDLASFATRCEKQMDEMVADPFQRKEVAAHAN
jgi:hypothetical protein